MYHVRPQWRNYNCGLYYKVTRGYSFDKVYLPQVELQAHSTILSTISRTVLTQTFANPSSTSGIREVRYTFPLYDGVSVVGFQCHIGDRKIVGEVKEKEKAKAVYQEAVSKGQVAGLFEQLPEAADVFTTTIGNVPPNARVVVEITYLGELKHDMEVDGIRFTIPNIICPRYGQYPADIQGNSAPNVTGKGISITVDAEMAEGSFIQKILSPSHPISVSMGTTSVAPNSEPTMSKASATLSLGTAELDTDFVLQIVSKDTGIPKAMLEQHPTVPNHRALMATLVPKFSLPAEKPEVVFVIDRSGSMGNTRIDLAKQALKVFLKSLPIGAKFNICSFGSHFSFLWPRSVTYSQQSLDYAMQHADTMTADYGGTEMLEPLKATIEGRYKDMSLEIVMLTDGETWNQDQLFSYLNKSITEPRAAIRVFTLGIGNGVSHSLIEGIARAGNGFSQTVAEGEKMDAKVVRMLKGALSPHVNDYTLEVKYSDKATVISDDEDDFEIIEKVADSLNVKLSLQTDEQKAENRKPVSLFDTSVDLDKEEPAIKDGTGESRYSHLPQVPVPKIIQAPQNIPSLFAFNRTTVYLLIGPDAPQKTPKSVILRGTSARGPLELEIPIQILESPGETIHQLAAKKAIAELEQGRGWLPEAKGESGALLKKTLEGRFSDMVEREAVRIGVQFQVGGKWCSFVAVEKTPSASKEQGDYGWLEDSEATRSSPTQHGPVIDFDEPRSGGALFSQPKHKALAQGKKRDPSGFIQGLQRSLSAVPPPAPMSAGMSSSVSQALQPQASGLRTFPSVPPSSGYGTATKGQSAGYRARSAPFMQQLQMQQVQQAQQSRQPQMQQAQMQQGLFGSSGSASAGKRPMPVSPDSANRELQDYQMGIMLLEQQNKKRLLMARQEQDAASVGIPFGQPLNMARSSSEEHGADLNMGFGEQDTLQNFDFDSFLHVNDGRTEFDDPKFDFNFWNGGEAEANDPSKAPELEVPKTDEERVNFLIGLQSFEGNWAWRTALFAAIRVSEDSVAEDVLSFKIEKDVFATALAIAFFEQRLGQFEGSWELVVEKARDWLVAKLGKDAADAAVKKAREVV
ncbi:VIT-domain-containing protein [Corynespora cassiicola Philippines]|uniref:VIT-domain-containing protein n=1 Tax=Corynespora cassiicola Philippines TaxID=1448308 RepID=A0A2T2P4J5_CORCC|nr:VIT-domain-containing protein [Corynespora cassiicola Philippines]